MADNLYVFTTPDGGGFSYAANTTKTLLTVDAPAGRNITLTELGISADGTSGTALALRVELCRCTFATAGTSTAAVTGIQTRGDTTAAQSTGARDYTAEPTVLTTIRTWFVTPNMGLLGWQFPLGREPMSAVGTGFALRVTNPTGGTTVNVRGYMEIEE